MSATTSAHRTASTCPPARSATTCAPPLSGRAPAAAVLAAAHRAGPSFRDQLIGATGLSLATVNRQVTALLDAGLLRERPDLGPVGLVGRPRIPVEVDPHRFGVLGMHIGVRGTTLAAADLRGRVLDALEVPNPDTDPARMITIMTARLRRFGERWPRRRMLRVGLVVGGQLSADRGRLRHPRLGWDTVPIAEIVDRMSDSDVVVMPQVEAMAAADTLLAGHPPAGTTLYVYAREAVGAALTVNGALPAPSVSPGTIAHLPVGGSVSCQCGTTGCLEASVGDTAVAEAARRIGIVPTPSIRRVIAAAEAGSAPAHDLLVERARLLGRGVALARDVFNPDRVVLLGQAFTAYRPGLAHLSASFAAASVLEPLTPRVSSLGSGVQALGACTAALQTVFHDPLGTVRKSSAGGRAQTPAGRQRGRTGPPGSGPRRPSDRSA